MQQVNMGDKRVGVARGRAKRMGRNMGRGSANGERVANVVDRTIASLDLAAQRGGDGLELEVRMDAGMRVLGHDEVDHTLRARSELT